MRPFTHKKPSLAEVLAPYTVTAVVTEPVVEEPEIPATEVADNFGLLLMAGC